MVPCMSEWTAGKVLTWATDDFKGRGIESPRLDAELLLGHVLKVGRLSLYTGFDRPLEASELAAYKQVIVRRRAGEPLAYITGEKEFWSLSFKVTPSVLIPRPDTETLVSSALARMGTSGRALDLCTGSGCVAAALASERPDWTVDATDLSSEALAVATENIERLGLVDRVRLLEGDLFAPVQGARFDIIVTNPPYVPDGEIDTLQPEVQREPRSALAGGADGLDLVRRIIAAAPDFLNPGASILLEVDPRQMKPLLAEVGPVFFQLPGEVVPDLSHTDRVLIFTQNGGDAESGSRNALERD